MAASPNTELARLGHPLGLLPHSRTMNLVAEHHITQVLMRKMCMASNADDRAHKRRMIVIMIAIVIETVPHLLSVIEHLPLRLATGLLPQTETDSLLRAATQCQRRQNSDALRGGRTQWCRQVAALH